MLLLFQKPMEEHPKYNLIPNSTQLPNILLDKVIPLIPEAEARCLLYICRRTFGFQKDSDRISFSQFMGGIKDRRGNVLDYGAGLARASVAKGLKRLVESGAVLVRQNTKGNYYQINLHMDVEKVVQVVNRSDWRTKIGSASRPKLVQHLNTQNQGKKEKPSIRDPVNKLSTDIRELTKKMTINRFQN